MRCRSTSRHQTQETTSTQTSLTRHITTPSTFAPAAGPRPPDRAPPPANTQLWSSSAARATAELRRIPSTQMSTSQSLIGKYEIYMNWGPRVQAGYTERTVNRLVPRVGLHQPEAEPSCKRRFALNEISKVLKETFVLRTHLKYQFSNTTDWSCNDQITFVWDVEIVPHTAASLSVWQNLHRSGNISHLTASSVHTYVKRRVVPSRLQINVENSTDTFLHMIGCERYDIRLWFILRRTSADFCSQNILVTNGNGRMWTSWNWHSTFIERSSSHHLSTSRSGPVLCDWQQRLMIYYKSFYSRDSSHSWSIGSVFKLQTKRKWNIQHFCKFHLQCAQVKSSVVKCLQL